MNINKYLNTGFSELMLLGIFFDFQNLHFLVETQEHKINILH